MTTATATKFKNILPGLALSLAVSVVAVGLEKVEEHYTGKAWLEALVLAILLGTAVRSIFRPGKQFAKGISFSAKMLLEIAVVLLGASISASAVIDAGRALYSGLPASW